MMQYDIGTRILLGFILSIALVSCGKEANKNVAWKDASTPYSAKDGLKGAIGDIPLYMPADVTDHVVGTTLNRSISMYVWILKSSDPSNKVIAYYEEQLSYAAKTPFQDGSAIWSWSPEGWEKGERIQVLVRSDGIFEITELVQKTRRAPKHE